MHSFYTYTRSGLVLAAAALAGCSTFKPPHISYDEPAEPAVLEQDTPKPVQVVEVPKVLPLPGGPTTQTTGAASPLSSSSNRRVRE